MCSLTDIPIYNGIHPGTGTNDHLHHWIMYRYAEQGNVLFEACQICGVVNPDVWIRNTKTSP